MKNLKDKININFFIILLIFLLPFLDIYKSIVGNKIEMLGISMVEIFNFIYVFILLTLLFIKMKKDNKKIFSWKLLLFGGIICIYLIGHMINISNFDESIINNSSVNMYVELYYIIKSYILPIILLYVFYKINIDKKTIIKTLSFTCLVISLIIVITNIFEIAFIAYASDYEGIQIVEGSIFDWGSNLKTCRDINLYTSKGWFYSANQMSAILSGLTFVSASLLLKENKFKYYLSFCIKCIALLMISTKTALFAIFLSIASVFVYSIYNLIVNKQNLLTIKSTLCCITIVIIMALLYTNSPVKYKLSGYISSSSDDRSSVIVAVEDNKELLNNIEEGETLNNSEGQFIEHLKNSSTSFGIPNEFLELYPIDKNLDFWNELIQKSASEVSNYRTVKYLIYQDVLQKNNNPWDKIFGIGHTTNFPELEKDILNQNIFFGYIGTLIFVIPFFIVLGYCFIKMIFNLRKYVDIENYGLFIGVAYIMLASIYAGHVFGMFIPSAFLSIILGTLLFSIKNNDKKKVDKKKITFLLLHLGYGGIETSTINTANALSEKYNVELISFYNLKDNQTKYINKNVSIKYLYNDGPNKVKFKEAVKKKNIIKILKEGLKAANILLKKKYLIKREILKSDSFALVSTRYDFSILLNKYGRNDVIKIAQEHHHHNNDNKYIKILKNKYKNINYLFALTEGLKKDYEKFLKKNKNTQIFMVPNMVDNNKEKSNLNSKNIISISRLHEGKKINELIDIFSELEDKETKLYIIGDGDEQENLKSQIKELKLENRVIMTGYLNKEEQKEYLIKSSVYAMTSISEGLPMILLEAMSYGIPCIAYKTETGVADIIEDNKNGFIIENRNKKEYIKRLDLLLKDINLKENMSEQCIKTCEKYSKDKTIKVWKDVLEN